MSKSNILSVVLIFVSVGLIWFAMDLRRDRDIALAMVARTEQAAALVAHHYVVAQQVEQKKLEVLASANIEISEAMKKLKKDLPKEKIKIVRVLEASTGEVVAGNAAASGEDKRCLLRDGDKAEIKISEVDVKTKAGNTVIFGHASTIRLTPEPKEIILSGSFAHEATRLVVSPPPIERPLLPSWAYMAIGVAAGSIGMAIVTAR